MSEPLILPTDASNVTLRELSTHTDDVIYHESYNASRAEITLWDPDSDIKHRTIEDTEADRLNSGDKLRMGIWDGYMFVGSANASPDDQGVEIGYWTDSRQVGKGYATLGAKALSKYVAMTFSNVHAEVIDGNNRSVRVLEKAGFVKVAAEAGRLSFHYLANAESEDKVKGIASYEDTLEFAGPFTTSTWKRVNYAWGSLFGRPGYGYKEGHILSGIVYVAPDGSTGQDLRPDSLFNHGRFAGWGVTLDSLVKAYESGSIHHLPDLRRKNKSYEFFKAYLEAKLGEPLETK